MQVVGWLLTIGIILWAASEITNARGKYPVTYVLTDDHVLQQPPETPYYGPGVRSAYYTSGLILTVNRETAMNMRLRENVGKRVSILIRVEE